MSAEIVIPIKKSKLRIQAIIYSVLAIVVFLITFGYAEKQDFITPIVFQGIGVIIPLFFVIAAGAKAKKMNDGSAGLIINRTGINDSSSHIGLGQIKWSDIVEIKEEESVRTGLLLIVVKKNEKFLRQAKNSAISRLLRQNIRMYDTPVAIDPSYLDGSLKKIIQEINDYKGW
ncbi:MAG: hypothetical protein BM555_04150 [Crocinitomix sp. MedPE-SWsnd]|nr:MAG: hypothetical protein BM555_04150 [Crocinitomix sp. MedPE-SWsnd]